MQGGQQASRRPRTGQPTPEEKAGLRPPLRWPAALANGRMAASMAEAALAAARTKSTPYPPMCISDPGTKVRGKLKVIKKVSFLCILILYT